MNKNGRTYLTKFRSYFFEAYGLNKFRNFIPPLECNEIDCPGYGTDECEDDLFQLIESKEDLIEVAYNYLDMVACQSAAVFAHCFNEEMFAIVKSPKISDENAICKTEDGINVTVFYSSGFDKTLFAEADAEYELVCYGLLIEKEPNMWKVVDN